MRIISRKTLRAFVESRKRSSDHAALKSAVDAWFHEASRASWQSMAEIKLHYATASPVTSERVVFNIKSNDYRLVVAIDFEKSIAWVKWIGTHKAYDKIDVRTVKHVK